jgi:hypothetical protein
MYETIGLQCRGGNSKAEHVLLLGFGEGEEDEDDFTPVMSKRSKKKIRSSHNISIRDAQSKSAAFSLGAQGKSWVVLVKAKNYHPLCGIVAIPRERRKNPKYK